MFKTSNEAKFQKDMTQGAVPGRLIRFALPFLLTMLIQQSYSMADLLIVSYFSGDASVAGVNIGGQVTFFVIAIAIGLSVGGTILIGQYYGAKKMEDVKKTASTILTMMLISSLIMAAIFIPLGDTILKILQAPGDSHAEALTYLIICICGLPFIFVYNAVAGIMRGLGDAKRPLIIVSISCVTNVLLNLLFVGYYKMGAAGAATATIICQFGTVVISSIYLSRSGFLFDFKLKSFVMYKDKLKLTLKLGIPSGISQIAVNASFLLLTMLVNSYGDVSISAATGLAGRFNGFIIMPILAISQSVSMMCAQNLGAGRQDRALRTMLTGVGLSLIIGVPFFFLVMFFPEQIMGIMSNSDNVIAAGGIYLRAIAWDYFLVPFIFSFFGIATGAGHTHITMINTFITSVALRIPAALILSRTFDLGLYGVGLSVPVASMGALIFLTFYILSGRWKNAVIHKQSKPSEIVT